MTETLSLLRPKIVDEQDALLKGLELSDLGRVVLASRERQRRIRRWALGLGSALVGVVAVTVVGLIVKHAFARLTYQIRSERTANDSAEPLFEAMVPDSGTVGRWVAATGRQRTSVAFSDGSKLTLFPDARLRIVDLARNRADLALEQGSVDLRVEGTGLEEYHLRVGPFELTIPSGQAQATWDPMTLQLELVVQRGYVVIAGCQFGDGRSVAAGKELGARCSEP
jgi:hypothetical protein